MDQSRALAVASEVVDDTGALRVHVLPRSRPPGVAGVRAGRLVVAVASPPEKGRATDEALRTVALWLGIKASAVRLRRGARGRDKLLHADGYGISDLRKRLAEALQEDGRSTG